MTNKEKYDKVFVETFSIDSSVLNEKLTYNSIRTWDSIGHMAMIAGLEEQLGIMMDTEDIIDFSSYTKGMEILAKYNIEIEYV